MTKWAYVEPIIEGWEEVFKSVAYFEENKLKGVVDVCSKKLLRCRTCVHRKRYALNEHSTKVVQCCELKPSKKSNSGFKTIKVTDIACYNYEEREKK